MNNWLNNLFLFVVVAAVMGFVLWAITQPTPAGATVVNPLVCGQEFSKTHSVPNNGNPDFENDWVEIDIQDFQFDDDRRVVVTPKNGASLTLLTVDYTGSDAPEATPATNGTNPVTYTAPNDQTIDTVVVELETAPCPEEPTPEEECIEGGGFWNGESCEEIPVCEQGDTYNEETNECETPEVEVCPEGQVGTPPDCTTPEEEPEEEPEEPEEPSNGGGSNGGGSSGGGDIAGGAVCGGNPDLEPVWIETGDRSGEWGCAPINLPTGGGASGNTGNSVSVPLSSLPATGSMPLENYVIAFVVALFGTLVIARVWR